MKRKSFKLWWKIIWVLMKRQSLLRSKGKKWFLGLKIMYVDQFLGQNIPRKRLSQYDSWRNIRKINFTQELSFRASSTRMSWNPSWTQNCLRSLESTNICWFWRYAAKDVSIMDLKNIFLQNDYIHQKVEIYGEPSTNMLKFLANQVLQTSEYHGNGMV